MAIENGGVANFASVMNMLHPDGTGLRIANTMSQENAIIDHIPWREGNLTTGHLLARMDNSLADGTWRVINQGITPVSDDPTQYTETCGRLERWNQIDEALAELNGGAVWRMNQDKLAVAKFGEQLAEALLYASTSSDPEQIQGLAPRYGALTGLVNSGYIIAGDNSGSDARSIYLINWSGEDEGIFGIYPKATKAGFEKKDLGLRIVEDSAGRKFLAWLTQMVWRCGLAVNDYRRAVRIQWDPGDAAMAAEEKGLLQLMQQAVDTIRPKSGARFYMDRTSLQRFHAQLLNNEARLWQTVNDMGRNVESYLGCPIHICDALSGETALT